MLEKGANPNIQLKRRPPYRDVPQDRGGDAILAQGATPLLRAARAGDAPFVELLLKHGALVDLPSKEGVTPLMAAAGVEFGTRVTRGRNRTDEGVLATMKLLVDAGANINARTLTEPRRETFDASAAQANIYAAGLRGRPARFRAPDAVPDQTALMGAAERGFTPMVEVARRAGRGLDAERRHRTHRARPRERRRRARCEVRGRRSPSRHRRCARTADESQSVSGFT